MLRERCAVAQDGDVVLVYHGFRQITPLQLKAGAVLQVRDIVYKHDDIIGHSLGRYIFGWSIRKKTNTTSLNNLSNIISNSAKTSDCHRLLILPNSADLWTQAVPHRTQIIYDTDIAIIVFHLRLKPGKVVVEAGTGSGSLTHSLVNAIAPHGHVYTCDFHQERCTLAECELRRNGLDASLVSCHWRDVCTTNKDDATLQIAKTELMKNDGSVDSSNNKKEIQTGFGVPANSVDAVFLDVPAPWSALDNVRHILRGNGMLCTFSPCIEQTQRTVEALRSEPHEFVDIRTVEALTKFYDPIYKRSRTGTSTITDSEEESSDNINNKGNNKAVGSVRFKPRFVSKGHSAYLTFARRVLRSSEDNIP